jgi:hypothetical protein
MHTVRQSDIHRGGADRQAAGPAEFGRFDLIARERDGRG